MPDNYDAGEGFAAGDDEQTRFDNDALIRLSERLESLIPDRRLRRRVFAEVVRAIFEARAT